MGIFSKEPILITAFVGAALVLLVEFGVPVTDGQQTAIQTLIAAALALFARSTVLSPATASAATNGMSIQQVTDIAKDPHQSLVAKPVSPMASSSAQKYGGSSGVIGVLLCVALASLSIACGPRNANTTPQTTIAEYGAEILKVTAAFQDSVITYAKAQGGNATTDRIMASIENHVTPQAKRLSELLKSYNAINDPTLKNSRAEEIEAQLQALITAYATVTNNIEAGKLASEAQVTSARIRELVAAVRLALTQSRAGHVRHVGDLAYAFE